MRDIGLTVVVKSLGQYSEPFVSRHEASFDKARIRDICKNLVSCGFLRVAVEATYQRCVGMTRLIWRSSEAFELVEKVIDEAPSSDSPAGKGGLRSTHPDIALLLESEKRDLLVFIAATAVHTKTNTNDRKPTALFNPRVF